jgi:hypothetical protein
VFALWAGGVIMHGMSVAGQCLVGDGALACARDCAKLPILVAAVVFSGLSLWGAAASEGFLEADACTHFLYARFALQTPAYLVDIWGRPLCTGLYALPAAVGGLMGVRVTSLVLALGLAWLTYEIARGQGYRWPAIALVFVLAQPLVFFHSFSELTELPFAVVVAGMFLAYQRRQWLLMAVLAGLGPLGRPEGFGFVLLAGAGLVVHRRWWWLPVLVLPLLLWSYVGWELYAREGVWWRWLVDHWPYAGESVYQSGHLLHFVALLPVLTGPVVFPALLLGVWASFRRNRGSGVGVQEESGTRDDETGGRGDREMDPDRKSAAQTPGPTWVDRDGHEGRHVRRCQVLIVVIPLMVLAVHSLLYWQGKMASNGELRYMLVVSCFWALLCARGWEWVFTRLEWRRPMGWAVIAAVLPVVSHLHFQVLPLQLKEDWPQAEMVARWYAVTPLREAYPHVMAAHPGFFYFLDLNMATEDVREWHVGTVAEAPAGTLLIWDPIYGVHNADRERSIRLEQIESAGWIELEPPGVVTEEWGWRMYVSPQEMGGGGEIR